MTGSAAIWRSAQRARTGAVHLFRFIRLATLGFTLSVAVSGVALADNQPSFQWDAAVLVLVAAGLFHVGVYVLNDVVDLDLDRTNRQRARTPLVLGLISTRTATWIASGSLLAGGLLLGLGTGEVGPVLWYAVATICLLAYDFYGKRCPLPPATDLVQGIGWGCLLLMGSVSAGGIGLAGCLLATAVCCYVLVVNGAIGGLRDLHNDMRHQARTTAVYLTSRRPRSAGVSPVLMRYCQMLQVAQGALCLTVAVLSGAVPAIGLVAAGQLLSLVALSLAGRRFGADRRAAAGVWGFVYIVCTQWTIVVAALGDRGVMAWLLVTAASLLPWSSSSLVRSLFTRNHFGRGRNDPLADGSGS